jgi:hypothetical protein
MHANAKRGVCIWRHSQNLGANLVPSAAGMCTQIMSLPRYNGKLADRHVAVVAAVQPVSGADIIERLRSCASRALFSSGFVG